MRVLKATVVKSGPLYAVGVFCIPPRCRKARWVWDDPAYGDRRRARRSIRAEHGQSVRIYG